MPQVLVYLLLSLALVIPVLGTVILRLLQGRLSENQFFGSAGVLFGIAIVSVLVLTFSSVPRLQVGELTLLLPLPGAVSEAELARAIPIPPTALPADETQPPSVSPTDSAPLEPTTDAEDTTATPSATSAATATSTPEPASPTPEPASPTPEPEPEPEEQITYVVESGDTLRGIAEEFDVAVEDIIDVNDLTPEEADSLSLGQELIIP